ncbi:MAG TPA: helix-turn-helix domain-containing protein [Sphingobacteriaceae bacterium]
MNAKNIIPDESIAGYVRSILVYNNEHKNDRTVLPFFADGYPGLIYHTAGNNMTLLPSGLLMKPLFIYGQTLHPIELVVKGSFQMVIFQLYPFALNSLFGLDAQSLNEDCYDLTATETTIIQRLNSGKSSDSYIPIITEFLSAKINSITDKDNLIKQSIRLIVESQGTITIKEITDRLHVTERTYQRLFKMQCGIAPKKFCKIIQFQASLEQLSREQYLKLGEIAYDKGFADQSHFIRIFKQYTGNTPSHFVK